MSEMLKSLLSCPVAIKLFAVVFVAEYLKLTTQIRLNASENGQDGFLDG